MSLLAASDWFEVLAAVIIFAVTGIAQLLQKRAKARRELNDLPTAEIPSNPSAAPAGRVSRPRIEEGPPVALGDWREQLRRLLEGQPPIGAPPPVLDSTPLSTQPARPSEIDESVSWEDRGAPSRELISLEEAPPKAAPLVALEKETLTRLTTASKLAAAREAYRQASNLSVSIVDRLRMAQARTESPRSSSRSSSRALPRATASRIPNPFSGLFLERQTMRQAIIATTVLQPPKALE